VVAQQTVIFEMLREEELLKGRRENYIRGNFVISKPIG
jgi:hypothetical protein